jgi:hypothetical protein
LGDAKKEKEKKVTMALYNNPALLISIHDSI